MGDSGAMLLGFKSQPSYFLPGSASVSPSVNGSIDSTYLLRAVGEE